VAPFELAAFPVRAVRAESGADGPSWRDGVLTFDPAALARELARDTRLAGVRVDVARPGDSTRIVHVLDAAEPRVKIRGAQSAFPGLLGPVELAGTGRTHRLDGVAVLTTVDEFWVHDGLSVKEAIVDMSGPGAMYSPFSRTINLVVSCRFASSTEYRERTDASVRAGLRAAEWLGTSVRHAAPDEVDVIDLTPVGLPRVAFVCFLMTEGDVHRTYVYGENVSGPPTLLHPTEVLDGAIVSGNYHTASNRNVTYFMQNHPIVRGLTLRHGHDVDFVGVIVSKALAPLPEDKERLAQRTGVLGERLGLAGAIIAKDSAGHATVDFMHACRALERRGISTVLVSEEFAGAEGEDVSLAYYVAEANAMVSTGNRDEIVALPAMEAVLGGDEILNPDRNDTLVTGGASSAFETSLRRFLCSATQTGAGHLTARTV
jgi:sarcosine reductase